MNVDEAALRELVNAEVEHQVSDCLQDSIATPAQETFMDAIQLPTDSVASQKKSTLTGAINVSIYGMIESERLDT